MINLILLIKNGPWSFSRPTEPTCPGCMRTPLFFESFLHSRHTDSHKEYKKSLLNLTHNLLVNSGNEWWLVDSNVVMVDEDVANIRKYGVRLRKAQTFTDQILIGIQPGHYILILREDMKFSTTARALDTANEGKAASALNTLNKGRLHL